MSDRTGSRILDNAISRLGDEKQQDLSGDEQRFSEIIDSIKNEFADMISEASLPTLEIRKQTTRHMMDLRRLLRLIAEKCRDRSLSDFGSRLCVKFVSSPVGSPLGPYGERSGHLIVFHAAISVLEILCRHSTEVKDWFRLVLPENLSDALLPRFYAQFATELLDDQASDHWKRFRDECEASRCERLISEKGVKAVNGFIPCEFADIFINSEDCRPLFTADGLKEAIQEISRLPWFRDPNSISRTDSRQDELPPPTPVEVLSRLDRCIRKQGVALASGSLSDENEASEQWMQLALTLDESNVSRFDPLRGLMLQMYDEAQAMQQAGMKPSESFPTVMLPLFEESLLALRQWIIDETKGDAVSNNPTGVVDGVGTPPAGQVAGGRIPKEPDLLDDGDHETTNIKPSTTATAMKLFEWACEQLELDPQKRGTSREVFEWLVEYGELPDEIEKPQWLIDKNLVTFRDYLKIERRRSGTQIYNRGSGVETRSVKHHTNLDRQSVKDANDD